MVWYGRWLRVAAFACLILFLENVHAQQYDMILQGGHVLDAKNHIDVVEDVAVKDSLIAKTAAHIDSREAVKTINVKGFYPGLIVGIESAHFDGPEWKPYEQAVKAGTIANIPVMIDCGSRRHRDLHAIHCASDTACREDSFLANVANCASTQPREYSGCGFVDLMATRRAEKSRG
jgi:predicted amidohydrolase